MIAVFEINGEPICLNHAVRMIIILGNEAPQTHLRIVNLEGKLQPKCKACEIEEQETCRSGFFESYFCEGEQSEKEKEEKPN